MNKMNNTILIILLSLISVMINSMPAHSQLRKQQVNIDPGKEEDTFIIPDEKDQRAESKQKSTRDMESSINALEYNYENMMAQEPDPEKKEEIYKAFTNELDRLQEKDPEAFSQAQKNKKIMKKTPEPGRQAELLEMEESATTQAIKKGNYMQNALNPLGEKEGYDLEEYNPGKGIPDDRISGVYSADSDDAGEENDAGNSVNSSKEEKQNDSGQTNSQNQQDDNQSSNPSDNGGEDVDDNDDDDDEDDGDEDDSDEGDDGENDDVEDDGGEDEDEDDDGLSDDCEDIAERILDEDLSADDQAIIYAVNDRIREIEELIAKEQEEINEKYNKWQKTAQTVETASGWTAVGSFAVSDGLGALGWANSGNMATEYFTAGQTDINCNNDEFGDIAFLCRKQCLFKNQKGETEIIKEGSTIDKLPEYNPAIQLYKSAPAAKSRKTKY